MRPKDGRAIICQLGSCPAVGRNTDYFEFRDAVIAVGEFSAFEATVSDKAASYYTRLCHDPEVEILHDPPAYPWTGVRRAGAGR